LERLDQPREWLDAEYLYKINYGPASSNDVRIAYKALKAADDLPKRNRITLLDRKIAQKLCESVFPLEREKLAFCIDWTANDLATQGTLPGIEEATAGATVVPNNL
jgi:hypothetical protein